MSTMDAETPETPMPTEPDAPDASVDAQIARATASELMAVTRAMFGLVDPAQQEEPESTSALEELQPASVSVPPVAAPHVGIPLPEVAPLSEHTEPEAAPPVAIPATPSVQAPAALPLPDAIPARRSLDLLQEIAFLDE